jgi:hypothetical protein
MYRRLIDSYIVDSNQSETRKYEVCYGEEDWGTGKIRKVIFTRVLLLINNEWVPQTYHTHILVEPDEDGKSDLDNVLYAIEKMRHKHSI